jgi:hypothetical protein
MKRLAIFAILFLAAFARGDVQVVPPGSSLTGGGASLGSANTFTQNQTISGNSTSLTLGTTTPNSALILSAQSGSTQSLIIRDSGATQYSIAFDRGNNRMTFTGPTAFSYFSGTVASQKFFVNSAPWATGGPGRKTLVDATATTVLRAAMDQDRHSGGVLNFVAQSKDATTFQTTSGIITWAAVDTTIGAGGETCAVQLVGTNATAASAGTLTCTAAQATGTDYCDIQLNCDTSIVTPTQFIAFIWFLYPGASSPVAQ